MVQISPVSASVDECFRLAEAFEDAAAIETIGRAGRRLPIGSSKLVAAALRRHAATLFAEQSAGHAQTPAEPGMQGAVQYRRKDGGYGPRWITMAMFDGTLAAESYCNLQRKDDKWPFEYRAIELPAVADTSTVWTEQDLAEAKAEAKSLSDYFRTWPSGCRDPDSCARHFGCMYTQCKHAKKDGNELAQEIRAVVATSPTGNSK